MNIKFRPYLIGGLIAVAVLCNAALFLKTDLAQVVLVTTGYLVMGILFILMRNSYRSRLLALLVKSEGQIAITDSLKQKSCLNLQNSLLHRLEEALDEHSSLIQERDRLLVSETRLLALLKGLKIEAGEIEKLAERKGQFLANVSHELRTPLNAIVNFAEFAYEETDVEEKNILIEQIQSSGLHLVGLVNDILDLSEIESGNLVLAKSEFNLGKQINLALNIAEVQATQKGVSLLLDADESLDINVVGDGKRFTQVLINLLGNAIKYNRNDGAIIFQAALIAEENDQLCLEYSVTDTGVGIPKHLHARIFDAYGRASSSCLDHVQSTGLGLYIAKQILEKMRGTIDLKSREGLGTRFQVRVPVEVAVGRGDRFEEKIESGINPVELSPDGQPLTVLVVEDNRVNQKVIQKILEAWGQRVQLASNGVEAIDRCSETDFDIVLMDIQMPTMDGIEATKLIHAKQRDEGRPEVPIIAVTAHAMDDEKKQFLSSGMKGYVSKPLSRNTLSEEIKRCLTKVH